MNTPVTAIARARQMLEVPFLHLGRDANGIDCVGLVAYAYGYPVALLQPYPRDPYGGQLQAGLRRACGAPVAVAPVPPHALQPGALVAMAYGRPVRHVGLVAPHPTLAGQLSLIHTDSRVGHVVEHILDAKWLRRVREVYWP
jgi:cell wall-associated NlpC family hydrolase